MNVYTNNNSSFPSQVVSNEEKGTLEYKHRKAGENEDIAIADAIDFILNKK